MHTKQMLGSTLAFPAALTWVTDSTTGATKLASRSICLRHVKTDNAEEFNKISNNICAAKQKKSLVSRKCRELDHKPIIGVPFLHVRWQTDNFSTFVFFP